ncbi:hypothetical protein F5Y03DRAFT_69013 [Xylaria venustula]|nr:hypothetical protein F5Y03DRAFT_69013 [Xylaria venustula]
MEHNTDGAEPLMDFYTNLPEMLAVDLEQSSDIFQSRQLTAGAPAPGLADDGAIKRHSPANSSSYTSSTSPDEHSDILPGSISQQTIQQKYLDIFAPLDFDPPKRDSISSSDSTNMKPPSLSTREESVLTVDTWLEPEKHPSPTFLHISPTSEYTAQMSWIDLDIEDISPVTQRRRSSMSDFPQYIHQLNGSIESNAKTGRPRRSGDITETSRNLINEKPFGYSPQIPRRRSSLQHQETQAATQKLTQYFDQGESYRHGPNSASNRPFCETSSFSHGNGADSSSHELDAEFTFRDNARTSLDSEPASPTFTEDIIDKPRPKENERDLVIASAAVGFDEWLESDLAYFACEDQLIPRPLPHSVQETIKFFVTNFPEPMLLCGSLLVENIRTLSQEVKYNTDDPKSDHPAIPGQQLNNHQQSKLPKWKWLGSSASVTGQQDGPSACSDISKQGWDVMRKVFPHGSDGLCEALYAYVLVYNYITSLCLRSPSHPVDSSRPTTPWTMSRPNTGKSTASSEFDMYAPTPPQPSVSENGIPRKAACILGMRRDDIFTATPSSPTRPRSGGSGGRTSTFTSLRSIPSFLFNGTSQGQPRQSESRSATPAGQRNNLSRPATPLAGRAGLRSMTSMGFHAADQGKQLAELRHGVAMCCARLTVTLHRADPNTAHRKSDKDCKVDPSFMRSLCENVRITEEAVGRSR